MKVLKVSKAEFAELKMRLKQRDKDGHDSLQLPPTLLTALQRTTGGHSTPNARPMNIAKVQIVRTDKALMSHADGSVTVKRAAVSPLANCSKRVTSADAHSVMQLREHNRHVAMPGIQSPQLREDNRHIAMPGIQSPQFREDNRHVAMPGIQSPQLREDNRHVAMPCIQSPLPSDTCIPSTSFLPTPPRTVQTVCAAVVTPTQQVLYAASPLMMSQLPTSLEKQSGNVKVLDRSPTVGRCGSVFLTPQSLARPAVGSDVTCRITPVGVGERRLLSTPCGNVMFCSPELSPGFNPLTSTPTAHHSPLRTDMSLLTPTAQCTMALSSRGKAPTDNGIAPSGDKMLNLMQFFS